jgi:hypothetical protein
LRAQNETAGAQASAASAARGPVEGRGGAQNRPRTDPRAAPPVGSAPAPRGSFTSMD